MKNWKTKVLVCLTVVTLGLKLVTMLKPSVDALTQDSPGASLMGRAGGVARSVHYGERTQPIRHIVVHSFSLPVDEMIKRLDNLGVSTHYLIDKNGQVVSLVPEDKVAWHAGVSFWRGQRGINATSVGIELQNDTLGQTPFSEKQLKAFRLLVKDIMFRYHIDPKNVVAHSDIAPARKVDVGGAFPWEKMAKDGIGVWPTDWAFDSSPADEATLLAQIGYDTSDIDKALLAFERRFMPNLIPMDGDIEHLEENLAFKKPVRNSTVSRSLKAVAKAYR